MEVEVSNIFIFTVLNMLFNSVISVLVLKRLK